MSLALALLFTAAFVGFSAGPTDGVSGTEKTLASVLELILAAAVSFVGVLIQPRSLTIAAAIVVACDRAGLADAAAGLVIFALLSTGALLGLFTYVVRRPTAQTVG